MYAGRFSIFVATLVVMTLASMSPGNADPLGVSGNFAVVDLRTASDVAAPANPNERANLMALLGATIRFGESVTWTDGRKCEASEDKGAAAPAQVDPNLSDLQIAPGSADRRRNRRFLINCPGRASGEVWQGLAVDDRVLVARSGASTTYLVLEMPVTSEESQHLKRGLLAAGFDPGPIDGPIDERARTAVAAYAHAHGARYTFATGIITQNVLDALTAIGMR